MIKLKDLLVEFVSENVKLKEWQGSLMDLRNDNKLPIELNKIGKDIISKNPNTKTADCWVSDINYIKDGSIRSVSGSITIKWKVYRKKNYSLEFTYIFEDGNIKQAHTHKEY
jgi:hypothetical protein